LYPLKRRISHEGNIRRPVARIDKRQAPISNRRPSCHDILMLGVGTLRRQHGHPEGHGMKTIRRAVLAVAAALPLALPGHSPLRHSPGPGPPATRADVTGSTRPRLIRATNGSNYYWIQTTASDGSSTTYSFTGQAGSIYRGGEEYSPRSREDVRRHCLTAGADRGDPILLDSAREANSEAGRLEVVCNANGKPFTESITHLAIADL
jgi:hypothetical protein